MNGQSRHEFRLSTRALLAGLVWLPCCGSGNDTTAPKSAPAAGESKEVQEISPGIHVSDGEVVFKTEEYTLDPGAERYLCYVATVDRDLVVDGYEHQGEKTLHHVVFARTDGAEPEGTSECDTLFRTTWAPMYVAGAGDSSLEFPPNTAHEIPAGTRLLSQLHLFNTSDAPAKGSLELKMHRATMADPAAINIYIFGNFEIQLPPLSKSRVESTCRVSDEVDLIAAFPHMHKLGTDLTFQAGPSPDHLTTVYQRAPYSFDDQRLETLSLRLSPGDTTHLACNYQNPENQTVTFGESTTNEMCFLVGFAVRPQRGFCVTGTPPASR
jgi:hypothetical protein